MEVTWPLLRDMILTQDHIENITWFSLMIDTQSEQIRKLSSDTVSVSVAEHVEDSIRQFCKQNEIELKRRNIQFECRAYNEIPTVHGFLFNDSVIFLSFCSIKNEKFFGAPNPYLRLDSPLYPSHDEVTVHFIQSFKLWFEYLWRNARKIWPT